MNRRAFLSAFSTAAAAIAFDPEKALWTPGKKLISIPKPFDRDALREYVGRIGSVEFQRAFLRYQAALQRGMDQLQRECRQDLAFVQGDRWPAKAPYIGYYGKFKDRPTSPSVTAPSHPAARS